jgi:hypothetical protein
VPKTPGVARAAGFSVAVQVQSAVDAGVDRCEEVELVADGV